MKRNSAIILGGGVTGLAAGMRWGLPIYEAENNPGGICSSYYLRSGSSERLLIPPNEDDAYRFEIGGGHWIFGADSEVMNFMQQLTPLKSYARKASVYFREQNLYVPYPLQNNLRYLNQESVAKTLKEISGEKKKFRTMKDWLEANFGPTLCEIFFYPFHRLYTSGLYETIAPQDSQKSPVNIDSVIQGAKKETVPAGYNTTFVYPQEGLNALTQRMADQCTIHYGYRVVKIDGKEHILYFSNGKAQKYEKIISTLPLNKMMEMVSLSTGEAMFPYTSVLVLNIGAVRGRKCPDDHWLYNPDAKSGLHRVGFYSNVDRSFLPASSRMTGDRVSIYVERSYLGGQKPSVQEVEFYTKAVVRELQEWEFIGKTEVVDPTWIDVAYTWAWPESQWKENALKKLEELGIHQMGRYGRWHFQGIAESIREGLKIKERMN